MTLQGKRITKKQAEILDRIFKSFDAIHEFIDEYGEEKLDMTDDSDTIVTEAECLYVSFGKSDKYLFGGYFKE